MNRTFLAVLLAATLSSCASVSSIQSPEQNAADGLTYYMPRKDVLLTITVNDQNKISGVTIAETPAYPDTSKRFVLRYSGNGFGKNTLNVGVSSVGLLTSSKATTVSSVNDAFKNLAGSVGGIRTFGGVPGPAAGGTCNAKGTYTFVLDIATTSHSKCGLNISISQRGSTTAVDNHTKTGETGERHTGIFYRQELPYLVEVTGGGVATASLVMSPSQSNTFFLPVSRTFFANNEADFVFSNGVPTQYKQDAESEVLALFKLPADIIGAYFTAVGQVFDAFKDTDTKEAEALAKSIELEIAKKKYEACLEAIAAEDEDKIKALGC